MRSLTPHRGKAAAVWSVPDILIRRLSALPVTWVGQFGTLWGHASKRCVRAMPDRIVYKIMSAAELTLMRRDGVFLGSPADTTDGYIHLSCASQLAATLDRHYRGVDGLMLAAVDLLQLGETVRWEPARGGQLFPHIYGQLPVAAVVSVGPVERTPDGEVRLPA
jgi:uncharacterized protein (DUF952 family)